MISEIKGHWFRYAGEFRHFFDDFGSITDPMSVCFTGIAYFIDITDPMSVSKQYLFEDANCTPLFNKIQHDCLKKS